MTPGKWRVDPSLSQHYLQREVYGPDDKLICTCHLRQGNEANENAIAIASLPDLLEACKGLARIVEAVASTNQLGRTQRERLEFARAAIARATTTPATPTHY